MRSNRPPGPPSFPPVGLQGFAGPFESPQKQRSQSMREAAYGSAGGAGGAVILNSAPTAGQQAGAPLQPVYDMHHYAWAHGSISFPIPVINQSFKFLESQQALRNMLGLRNPNGVGNLYIEFGNQATPNSWLQLAPGQYVLFDMVIPQDDLFVLSDNAAAVSLTYLYSTYTP